jgi:hypothetical protein
MLPVSLDCPYLIDPSVFFTGKGEIMASMIRMVVGLTFTYAIDVYYHLKQSWL